MSLLNSLPQVFVSAAISLIAGAVAQLHKNEYEEIVTPLFDEVYFTYEGATIQVGSVLVVDTDYCGKQIGRVYDICENPFGAGMSAYVTWLDEDIKQPHWTTYLDLEIEVA